MFFFVIFLLARFFLSRKKEKMSTSSGKLELIVGPMFSGKTTETQRRVKRFEIAKMKTLKIKSSFDTRYSKSQIVSHEKQKMDADFCVDSLCDDEELLERVKSSDVVVIDDAHFLQKEGDLYKFCWNTCFVLKKLVIVNGIDCNWMGEPFVEVVKLLAIAEEIVKLKSVCDTCKNQNAIFTTKYTEDGGCGKVVVLEIGEKDKYNPACPRCYSVFYERCDVEELKKQKKELEEID